MAGGKGGAEEKAEPSSKKSKTPSVIRAPGGEAAKKKQQIADAKLANAAGKRQVQPEATSAGGGGKKKKGRGGGGGGGGGKKQKKKKKGNAKGKKKGCIGALLASYGIGASTIHLSDPKAIEAAQSLEMTQAHLRRLKTSFEKIDLDGSGNIDVSEFLESLGEVRSPFTDKLFSVIDVDGSGTIEFDEYVLVLSTYCMFSKDEILRFCFECFDVDGSGTIDEKEFIELCKTVNNANPTFPKNFSRALQEFDVNEDGLIDYGEFLEIERRYPLILFPAFRLQDMMQKISMGEDYWLEIIAHTAEEKRIEEYKATHGGRAPPEPLSKKLGKLFCPCFFKSKTYSKLDA